MSKTSATANGQSLWSKVPKTNAELFALTYGALVTEVLRDVEEDIPKVNQQLEQIGYSIGIRCVDEFLAKASAVAPAIATTTTTTSTTTSSAPNPTTATTAGTSSNSNNNNVNNPSTSATTATTSATSTAITTTVATGSAYYVCRTFSETAEVLGKTAFKMFLGITVDVQHVTATTFRLLFSDNPLSLFVELPDTLKDVLEYNILYCGIIRGALEMLNYKVECTFVQSPLRGHDIHEIKVDLVQVLQDGAGDDYHEE